MSEPSKSLEEAVDSILEASGDLVLKLGSERGRLVPNAGVDVSELNKCIHDYQKQLDLVELEIRQGLHQN
ncbi:hypothetical protein B9G98_01476 [Wickerhamiella sorbophila]|uniref:Uncharacterized protein n=1 Tax=Wickerhamiella sorbophila TaxID=45607 RepID=A0A2T0FFT5_9ASCO|nr:hypothetical protein B9G98_01476 [Wickerhamiella sorbophila]PRT53856.1 hypothetical protein B9G98_01476 [Wickerhamiella sorbophila]